MCAHQTPLVASGDYRHPMRDLLLLMPRLDVRGDGEIDWEAAEPELLKQIGSSAGITMQTLQRGSSAIGLLLVHVSPEVGTGEIPADVMEALGWLLAEINTLAAIAHCLAAACQRHTADYAPPTSTHIPPARP